MSFLLVESLIVIILSQAVIILRPGLKNMRRGFWITSLLIFLTALYRAIALYFNWRANDFTRQFLPPYNSWAYFTSYSFFKFFAPFLIAVFAALLLVEAFSLMNKKSGERFFEKEEIYFAAIAIIAMGYPAWVVYIPIILISYLIYHLVSLAVSRRNKRLSFYYLWFPIALFVILISEFWLKYCFWWSTLKI
jgi:hypothetical protein